MIYLIDVLIPSFVVAGRTYEFFHHHKHITRIDIYIYICGNLLFLLMFMCFFLVFLFDQHYSIM